MDHIGFNVNTSFGLVTAPDHAFSRNATAFQVFLKSPHSFNQTKRHDHKTLALTRTNYEKHNMKVVVHGSYIMNFCRPKTHYVHQNGLKLLIDDLDDSVVLGAVGVVIHMGKAIDVDKKTALNNYVDGLIHCLKNSNQQSKIILETGAGVGNEVGTLLPSLGAIRRKIPKSLRHRVGFCLDTCHMFAAGYNLGDVDYVNFVIKEVKIHLGWENVLCIHLNDSYKKLNSHADNHADLGRGYINLDGLSKFTKHCVEQKIMIVLETPADWFDENNKRISVDKHNRSKIAPKNATRFTFADQVKLVRDWIKIKDEKKPDPSVLSKETNSAEIDGLVKIEMSP